MKIKWKSFLKSQSHYNLLLDSDSNRLHTGFRECNSVENILDKNRTEDDRQFLEKYRQMDISGAEQDRDSSRRRRYSMVMLPSTTQQPYVEKKYSPSDNNVILSKTVRGEKRRQREKRERSYERLDDSTGWWQISIVSTVCWANFKQNWKSHQ